MRRLGRLIAQLLDVPVNQTLEQYQDPAVLLDAAFSTEHPRFWASQDWVARATNVTQAAGAAGDLSTSSLINRADSLVDLIVIGAGAIPVTATATMTLSVNPTAATSLINVQQSGSRDTRASRGVTSDALIRTGLLVAAIGQPLEQIVATTTGNQPARFTCLPIVLGPNSQLSMQSADDASSVVFHWAWIEIPRAPNAD